MIESKDSLEDLPQISRKLFAISTKEYINKIIRGGQEFDKTTERIVEAWVNGNLKKDAKKRDALANIGAIANHKETI